MLRTDVQGRLAFSYTIHETSCNKISFFHQHYWVSVRSLELSWSVSIHVLITLFSASLTGLRTEVPAHSLNIFLTFSPLKQTPPNFVLFPKTCLKTILHTIQLFIWLDISMATGFWYPSFAKFVSFYILWERCTVVALFSFLYHFSISLLVLVILEIFWGLGDIEQINVWKTPEVSWRLLKY